MQLWEVERPPPPSYGLMHAAVPQIFLGGLPRAQSHVAHVFVVDTNSMVAH